MPDMSKTETCQSRRAATNEKKGGILSRLIRQNAFNSRSVGRDDVDQWIKRRPYFPPNKTKAFNALFFRTVGRDDVDKWIKRCSLDVAWTVRILRDQKHCVDASGMSDLHRTVVIFIASCSTSDGADKSWKSSTIAVRSSHDRAAIAARSNHDITSFIAESFQPDPTAADRDPGPRSWPDRGLIVALFESKFKPIHPRFEATMPLSANRSHHALIPPPRTRQLPMIFGPIPLFKSMYFSSLFFNF